MEAAINKILENMSLRIASLNQAVAELSQKLETLDRDRLDQWKIISDICKNLNIKFE